MVGAAAEEIRHQIERRSQLLRIELSGGGAQCEGGDAHRLTQALSALLGNASKFSPAGAPISVSVLGTPEGTSIVVRDVGIGIAPELLPHVFEAFVQGSAGESEGGLGVGLTIAKQVANLHGGHLRVESAGIHLGTEATLTLPHKVGTPDVVADLSAISGRRVLIVEDDADARESLRILIEAQGNEVVAAADAAQGLELATTFSPDYVICDIGLPDVNGFDLVRSLRDALAGQPTRYVAVTGYGRLEDQDRAMESGFDSFVVKPIRRAGADESDGSISVVSGNKAGAY